MNCDTFGGGSTHIAVSVGDGLHEQLKGHETVYCHRNCISTYTHIKIYLSKKVDPKLDQLRNVAVVLKKYLASENIVSSVEKNASLCGILNRWCRVIQCRTADCGPTQNSFKDAVLET